LIWEVGSGYFGCRNRDGSFNPEEFARIATIRPIKMVSNQGQPGRQTRTCGVLPRRRSPKRFRRIRASLDEDAFSAGHAPRVSTPLEMMGALYRRDAGGCPRQTRRIQALHRSSLEFLAIAKAMIQSGIDRISSWVAGNEGHRRRSLEFMDHLGMPMREGVIRP